MDGKSGEDESELIWLRRSNESRTEKWSEPESWFQRWGNAYRSSLTHSLLRVTGCGS